MTIELFCRSARDTAVTVKEAGNQGFLAILLVYLAKLVSSETFTSTNTSVFFFEPETVSAVTVAL